MKFCKKKKNEVYDHELKVDIECKDYDYWRVGKSRNMTFFHETWSMQKQLPKSY